MKRKIGIVTFHRVLNYGALLQAFALRTAIMEIGVQAEIIDYRNDILEKMYEYPGYFSQRGIKNKLRYIFYSRTEKKKRKRFEAFRQNYLGIKDVTVYRKDDLSRLNGKYDAFFSGSDQVWSPHAHKLDGSFFLDFVSDPKKKYSYAASFGVAYIKKDYYGLYKKWLNDFQICSVREKQGEALIHQMMDIPVRIDADPVLLLAKEEWKSVLRFKEQRDSKKYVFIYSFGMTEIQKKMAIVCYKAGLKIYIVGESIFNPLGVPCEFVGDLGPKEFAEMLYGASFVITNSFHGTALSIVYNVPFALEYLVGSASKSNSRLENIIAETNLQARILTEKTDFSAMLNSDICWNDVNALVNKMRTRSMDYLRECLHE